MWFLNVIANINWRWKCCWFQTFNFSAVLLVKTGRLKDKQWERLPIPFKFNADPLLANTADDPMRYLTLTNYVEKPSMDKRGNPWRGPHEKSCTFFQILIDMCSNPGDIVVDLSASTGASLLASRASGRHFFGIEEFSDIYDAILKPLIQPLDAQSQKKRRGMDSTPSPWTAVSSSLRFPLDSFANYSDYANLRGSQCLSSWSL